MKKNRLFFMFAALLVAAAVMFSCQKEEMVKMEDGLMLKVASTYPTDGCASVCIEPESGDYWFKSGTATGVIGANSKQIAYTVYNTETDFVVELTYSRTPVTAGITSTVKVTVDGVDQTKSMVKNTAVIFTFPKTIVACQTVNWSFVETTFDGANALSAGGTYDLIGVCQDCEESFNYVANLDGTYTFTYTPEENMEDALVVFTFAQTAIVTLDGFSKAGATMQATLDFEACVPVSWTVKFVELRCIGVGQDDVNAWTDFTINEFSKKNSETPNIVLPCSGV